MAVAKHLTAGLAFAALAFAAAPADRMSRPKLDDPGVNLVVEIERKDNSVIKATLTNTGDLPYRILKTNTFLDESPVDKVTITCISDGTSNSCTDSSLIFVFARRSLLHPHIYLFPLVTYSLTTLVRCVLICRSI